MSAAPRPTPTIPSVSKIPGFLRNGKAGVVSTAPGPGEQRLDEVCARNGWAWGKIGTYFKDGRPVTAIIVGTIIEGEVPPDFPEPMNALAVKAAEDAACGDVADFLVNTYENGDD